MSKIEIGSIVSRKDSDGITTTIELDKTERNPFPDTVGHVTIYIQGNHQDLINKIESQVKRTISSYGKTGKK